MMCSSEQVLCFPTAKLTQNKALAFTGFSPNPALDSLLDADDLIYIDRDKAENDPGYLQIIPYVIVGAPEDMVLTYLRGKKGGESRLHDKRSVGFGGHINPVDGEPHDDGLVERGMLREIKEELGIEFFLYQPELVGFLYDPSNDVGKVHFGAVYLLALDSKVKFASLEEALNDVVWRSSSDLKNDLESYETWSQLSITNLL